MGLADELRKKRDIAKQESEPMHKMKKWIKEYLLEECKRSNGYVSYWTGEYFESYKDENGHYQPDESSEWDRFSFDIWPGKNRYFMGLSESDKNELSEFIRSYFESEGFEVNIEELSVDKYKKDGYQYKEYSPSEMLGMKLMYGKGAPKGRDVPKYVEDGKVYNLNIYLHW